MIHKLIQLYPNLIKLRPNFSADMENYIWFKANDEILGIPKEDLTDNEQRLLEAFFEIYQIHQPQLSDREKTWSQLLYQDKSYQDFKDAPISYRFVFFALTERVPDSTTFHEAIQGLFSKSMPILWENDYQGVIIEEISDSNQEQVSYNQVIDILMSDFYMKLNLYISEFFTDIERASSYFHWSKENFATTLGYVKKPVITYIDAIPYRILNRLDNSTKELMKQALLKEVIDDKELLKTIKVFLSCNSNATLAAKKLYMHRNSLQYRVDKFIEKTGVDVKNFHGALTTYLTLLLLE